jgi:hypothetical protein
MQYCALGLDLESMLLAQMRKIFLRQGTERVGGAEATGRSAGPSDSSSAPSNLKDQLPLRRKADEARVRQGRNRGPGR